MRKGIGVIITIIIAILISIYKDNLETYFKKIFITNTVNPIKAKDVYTLEELSQYNGLTKKMLYLAFMGSVFDVSKGIKHYGGGAPYNYFVGKDGSRAFISGNFMDESENKDHILDFTCDELINLLNWKKMLTEKYNYVGTVIGRYFDEEGKETKYLKQFKERIILCHQAKEQAKEENLKYPDCNIEWSAEKSTRVWCSKSSGGVRRSWIGVPRQLYSPGQDHPRCVCVNIGQHENETALLKEYDNCSSGSTSCYIKI
ncbi:hypothetical protein ACJJTC_006609 [Scirpophaga incertulas]